MARVTAAARIHPAVRRAAASPGGSSPGRDVRTHRHLALAVHVHGVLADRRTECPQLVAERQERRPRHAALALARVDHPHPPLVHPGPQLRLAVVVQPLLEPDRPFPAPAVARRAGDDQDARGSDIRGYGDDGSCLG